MITGKTALYGIFGYPVEHTFSPGMHNAAFQKLALDAAYVPFAVHPDRLAEAMQAIIPLGLKGLNVTVPHKERVVPLLHDLSQEARLIGAVNTIEVRDGALVGHNTDGRGFLRSMKEDAGFSPRKKRILIIGSGGAARAVSFSLALAGASSLALFDSEQAKAERLAADLAAKTGVAASPIGEDGIAAAAAEAHCIINATPLGLKKSDILPIGTEYIAKKHLVCDLVYNPPDTGLLRAAKARGAKRLGGIGMLLFQGVIAFEIWTGRKPPVALMKKALAAQLRSRR